MEKKTVTLGVPIGLQPPIIGQAIISTWGVEETMILVETIDSIEWKIYDDIKELMVTVTGTIIQ